MDEGESASAVFRDGDGCAGKARDRCARAGDAACRSAASATRAAATHGPRGDGNASGGECSRGSPRDAGGCRTASRAGGQDAIRAADADVEKRTDGHGRDCGGECEGPVFDSAAAAIQPGSDQHRGCAARSVSLGRDTGDCDCVAGGQGTWAGDYFRDTAAEYAGSGRQRDADGTGDQSHWSGDVEFVDCADQREGFAAEAHCPGNKRSNFASPAVVELKWESCFERTQVFCALRGIPDGG